MNKFFSLSYFLEKLPVIAITCTALIVMSMLAYRLFCRLEYSKGPKKAWIWFLAIMIPALACFVTLPWATYRAEKRLRALSGQYRGDVMRHIKSKDWLIYRDGNVLNIVDGFNHQKDIRVEEVGCMPIFAEWFVMGGKPVIISLYGFKYATPVLFGLSLLALGCCTVVTRRYMAKVDMDTADTVESASPVAY